jgi:hypothetical protein
MGFADRDRCQLEPDITVGDAAQRRGAAPSSEIWGTAPLRTVNTASPPHIAAESATAGGDR